MRQFLLYLSFLIFVYALPTGAQAHHGSGYPQPPEPADKTTTTAPSAQPTFRPRAQPVELQRDARELLELSQSLQPDIDSINHGLLPKETIQKLRRIEKLAKHLRTEISP